MTHKIHAAAALLVIGAVAAAAHQTAPPAGGRGTAQPAAAAQVPSISQRPNGSSLGTIRVGAADNNIWFGWRVAMPSAAIKGLMGDLEADATPSARLAGRGSR